MVKELMHDPIFLAVKSETATVNDKETAVDLMDTLLFHREECVGMAANMIGVRKNIIAFLDESGKVPQYSLMYNPEIIKKEGAYETEEGCLSLLGGKRKCIRHKIIKVKWQNENFETRIKTFKGFTAEIIEHEVDHLKGVLI